LKGLGVNKTPGYIFTAGSVLGALGLIMDNFDAEIAVGKTSGMHLTASMDADLCLLLREHSTSFRETPGKSHLSFPKPLHPLSEKRSIEIQDYIVSHVRRDCLFQYTCIQNYEHHDSGSRFVL